MISLELNETFIEGKGPRWCLSDIQFVIQLVLVSTFKTAYTSPSQDKELFPVHKKVYGQFSYFDYYEILDLFYHWLPFFPVSVTTMANTCVLQGIHGGQQILLCISKEKKMYSE